MVRGCGLRGSGFRVKVRVKIRVGVRVKGRKFWDEGLRMNG